MTLVAMMYGFTADDEKVAAITGLAFLEYVCMRCSQDTGIFDCVPIK